MVEQHHQHHKEFVVYTPESRLRHPLNLFREMGRDLLAARELAWRLLVRDITAQYRQSFLGIFWAFVPPIATALALTVANNAKVINIGETDLPYPAYVMFSMTLWQTFVESLNGPLQAVNQAKMLLVKINFPKEAIILAKLGQIFFNFGIKLILIVGLFLWFQIPVSWGLLAAPVGLIHLIALGVGISLLLIPVGTLYQDVIRAMTYLTSAWLFLTPVIYQTPREGIWSTIVRFNPVTPLLVTTRELATGGEVSDPVGFWVASGVAIVGVLLGWVVYRLAMPLIVERMSS